MVASGGKMATIGGGGGFSGEITRILHHNIQKQPIYSNILTFSHLSGGYHHRNRQKQWPKRPPTAAATPHDVLPIETKKKREGGWRAFV